MKITITHEELNASVAIAEKEGLFSALSRLYGTLKSGKCAGCTQCCSESVNAFYIEFLAIWNQLQQDEALKVRLMPRILRYYMLEMVVVSSCPFLDDDGRCAVYHQRPLVCRQFGHWSRKDFTRNIDAVLKANREAADYYRDSYGMMLPETVVNRALDYCEDFKVAYKTGPMKRGEQADAVFMLDTVFLGKGLLSEELLGTPLVTWFIYTLYSPEEAGELRLKVMREYLEKGVSETLDGLMTQC